MIDLFSLSRIVPYRSILEEITDTKSSRATMHKVKLVVAMIMCWLDFNYTLKDTKDCILFTEGKLQDLTHAVMSREHGSGWDSDANISWSKAKREGLEHRKGKREEEFYAHTNSDRLIDYCYLLDLKELLTKNRPTFFTFLLAELT